MLLGYFLPIVELTYNHGMTPFNFDVCPGSSSSIRDFSHVQKRAQEKNFPMGMVGKQTSSAFRDSSVFRLPHINTSSYSSITDESYTNRKPTKPVSVPNSCTSINSKHTVTHSDAIVDYSTAPVTCSTVVDSLGNQLESSVAYFPVQFSSIMKATHLPNLTDQSTACYLKALSPTISSCKNNYTNAGRSNIDAQVTPASNTKVQINTSNNTLPFMSVNFAPSNEANIKNNCGNCFPDFMSSTKISNENQNCNNIPVGYSPYSVGSPAMFNFPNSNMNASMVHQSLPQGRSSAICNPVSNKDPLTLCSDTLGISDMITKCYEDHENNSAIDSDWFSSDNETYPASFKKDSFLPRQREPLIESDSNYTSNSSPISVLNPSKSPPDSHNHLQYPQYLDDYLSLAVATGSLNFNNLTSLLSSFNNCDENWLKNGLAEDETLNVDDCLEYFKPKHRELREIESKVIVEPYDPSVNLPPLNDWKDLNLDDNLLKGLYQKGYHRPSKIQKLALPLIFDSSRWNLIAQAQNGSGKTATFALAMLNIIDRTNKLPQAMCLCPTRELAIQNLGVIRDLGKFTSTTYYLAVPLCPRVDLAIGCQILVGTPGKTMEILKKKQIPTQNLKLFVLDEADEMIDHRNNMAPQVEQIRRFFSQPVQILLFSATYDDFVRQFATKVVPRANKIIVNKEDLTLDCVRQYYIECSNSDQKLTVLSELYGCLTVGQSVIFVNSRKTGFDLCQRMRHEGHVISLICGSARTNGTEFIDSELRDSVMNEFRSGTTKVLICTDLICRGIDVPQVTLVINYDLPTLMRSRGSRNSYSVNMETYIHRIGRTGRFGLKGIAINLMTPDDIYLLEEIKTFYQCQITKLHWNADDIEEMVRNLRI